MKKRLSVCLAFVFLGLLVYTRTANAQDIPPECRLDNGYADISGCYPECFNQQGLIDLRVCLPTQPWYIPPALLWDGYIGTEGGDVPFLPSYRMDSYFPGPLVQGYVLDYNVDYMSERVSYWTKQLGLNPEDYIGGVAYESCGYEGYSVWIYRDGVLLSAKPAIVADCRGWYHKYELACDFGTVGDMPYVYFGWTDTGKVPVTFYLAPPGTLNLPEDALATAPIDYTASWLQEAGMSC